MLRSRIILTFIILICNFCNAHSQIASHQKALNYQFEQAGNSDAALKEYLREYYLDSKSESDKLVPLKIAELFAQRGDIENAIKYYNIQYFDLPYNSDKKDSIRYEKIHVFLNAKDYKKAKIEVLQINKYKEKDINRYYLYKGLIYYFNDQFEDGFDQLNQISYLTSKQKEDLNKLSKKLIKNGKVNPKLHQIASGIFPGLGQYIAGDFKNGLNSTLLNGGFVYLFFVVGERLSYGDAIISVTPWLMRYFIGGVGNAKTAAEQKKLRRKSDYIKKSIDIIQSSKQ